MDTKLDRINPMRRLAYAFAGLLAGDMILLLYLLQNALRARAALLAIHMGEPERQIPAALDRFVLYAVFSFVGWLSVGATTALLFPAASLTRLSWPLTLAVGAALGPPAMLVILLLLGHGRIYFPTSHPETATLFAYSMLVSTVSFGVYVGLLRQQNAGRSA